MAKFLADPRFRVLSWTPNRGVGPATDRLFQEVRAPFWCYPGADDLLHPTFVERRLLVATSRPDVNVIFGQGIQIDEKGADLWYHPLRVIFQRLQRFDDTLIGSDRMLKLLLQENVVNTPSIFCRSDVTLPILRGKGVEWHAQDYYYWIRLAAGTNGFYYDHEVLHSYRIYPTQSSRSPHRENLRLAEFRLIPLVALSEAAGFSPVAAERWKEWRQDLYCLWLIRVALLIKRRGFQWPWQDRAACAYHGRRRSRLQSLLDFCLLFPRALLLRRAEIRRASRQVFVHGLRKIDDVVFRDEKER